jgi:hypothetical protein
MYSAMNDPFGKPGETLSYVSFHLCGLPMKLVLCRFFFFVTASPMLMGSKWKLMEQ